MNVNLKMQKAMKRVPFTVPLMLALAAGACLAQSYPSKPLRVMVASVAGGPPDIIMRGFSEPLRQEFGQPIVIENVPQGDGIVAAQNLIRAAADGYNILMASAGPITVNPVLQKSLPYEPRTDLAPVVMIAQFNSVFVANAAVPANNLRELIALAKAKPGAITFGTAGTPTTSNLYAEWFRHNQGIDFYNVPYKSNPQALQAVIAGEVQATVFAAGAAMAQAKAGKTRVLAIISDKRVAGYPDLPTVREEGLDIVIRNWYGLFVKAGTGREIVDRWNRSVARVTLDTGFQEKILFNNGMERATPSGESSEVFAQFLARDRALYERLKNEGKLKIE
ncbi:MAG: tripartite tricarboxylate transporter substrate binding protein [Betaproteobacteria bacterium]|nr:tripartite tricarboxylate transporter substrate binding protein [Betaproteobacteria bacterium]